MLPSSAMTSAFFLRFLFVATITPVSYTHLSYTEDLDEDGEKSAEDAEEKADEEKAMEAVENGPLSEERRQELLKTRRDGLKDVYKRQVTTLTKKRPETFLLQGV